MDASCAIAQYHMQQHDTVQYSAKSSAENEVKMLGVSAVDCGTVPYIRVLVYDNHQRVSLC